ncbi:hypothetical protein ANCCAN_14352 [Ancylostoma caninum]|nr:hypothetical protein ANCCAN_14352 [Ancylostoma caninum]
MPRIKTVHSKVTKSPRRPFEKERLDQELKLIGEFGLKNKREVWRVKYTLAKVRKAARELLTLEEKDPKRLFEGNALLRRLVRIGVLPEDRMKLDYILGLRVEDFLERRLQTQVFKLGLAKSIHHARVLIRHSHIRLVRHSIDLSCVVIRLTFRLTMPRIKTVHSKVTKSPRRPFEKERLDQELKLIGEFGLKNKREVWRVKYTLAKVRKAARELLTLEEKDPKRLFEGNALLRRLVRIGVLPEDRMKLDYILGLRVEDFLERRLQTQVFKLGLAKSIHHARVLIRHSHIRVRRQVVDVPSLIVRLDSQKHIDFSLKSPFGGGRPGRVKRRNMKKAEGGEASGDDE